MKQEKLEILLEGLTEDLAEIKMGMEGGASEQLEVICNLNSKTFEKVSELLEYRNRDQQKLAQNLKVLQSEIRLVKATPQTPLFPKTQPEPVEESNAYSSLFWPFPRLIKLVTLVLVVVCLVVAFGYFKYLHPAHHQIEDYQYQISWLKRAIPESYTSAMEFYVENKNDIDRATDSLYHEESIKALRSLQEKFELKPGLTP